MAVTVKGIVHGKTVELEQASGWPDGQEVTVTLAPAAVKPCAPGEGLRQSFGAWADDAQGLDDYLDWARRQRKVGRREIDPRAF